MSLNTGARLGPYEILAPIGAGGMGEVYRAHDSRLNRDVAIKVSAERFSDRFEREAHSIAALNHSNICTLHDVGPNYLVMELVEGPTLADQIKEGPLPLEEALEIARQIADALEAAHEKGIVHRDLKPGNIKLKPDGTVKVLDFGLAKVTGESGLREASPEKSPTQTFQMATRAGMILGTAAYMAPEQARGKSVDRRADIWAFGVVLLEMLMGRQTFTGETTSDVLAAVVKDEPDLSQAPPKVRRLLRACLQKDPKQRLQAIGDWRLLLEEAVPVAKAQHTGRIPWAMAAVFALIALASGFAYFRRTADPPRALKVFVLPPEKASLSFSVPAVSPNGRLLAYVATRGGKDSLWVRDLDSLVARQLPGTEDANNPFWSPDSRFIAFFAAGKLKRIEAAGGPALSLCDVGIAPLGGSWSKKDVIVFAPDFNSGLLRIPAAGGNATAVTKLDPNMAEGSHGWPSFLPDGQRFLYSGFSTSRDKTAVYVEDIDSRPGSSHRRQVLAVNSNAAYAPPGYLMFQRDGTLMAQPFDAAKATATGDAIPVVERVDYFDLVSFVTGSFQGQFSVSQNGVLIYTSGLVQDRQLTLLDRSGKVLGTVGAPGVVLAPQFSPDGNAVVAERVEPQTGNYDLWIHDLKRGTARRFTFNSKSNFSPAWSRDGRHIAFTSTREGDGHLYQKETSGEGREEALDKTPGAIYPNDWSRDGRYLVSGIFGPKDGKQHIWVLPLLGDRKPYQYFQSAFNEGVPRLSPNGQWIAYASDETGKNEIYIQSFPKPGAKSQVSANGGNNPAWSQDGKELFFASPDKKLMVVEVKVDAEFQAGVPKALFDMHNGFDSVGNWFDVSTDGKFLVPTAVAQDATVPITVWTNWTAGLKK